MELRRKVAVVTGASSGLGEAMARRLAREGMRVVAVARRAAKLNDLAASADGVEAYVADVTSDEQVDELAAHVAERHGACHVLINNAGQGGGGRGMRGVADRQVIADVMDVNFFSAVRTMTAFAPLLEASAPSQVINVASVAGKVAVSGPYSASKFALVGLTEAVGADWDRRGIRVTQLNPGFIRTEGFPQEGLMASPLTRWLVGEADLVAGAAVDAIRRRPYERTAPRWYRVAVVARHIAAPVVRAALRGF